VIDWLRNKSRPYLFSNTVPPPLAYAALKTFDLIEGMGELRQRLKANTARLRGGLEAAGFTLKKGPTPILPVMIGDAALAVKLADRLLDFGVYVIAFSYPVVAQGQARIRLQTSAAHTDEQIDLTIAAFTSAGRELGIIR
jgi:glycine C-acetyltransferase